MWALLPLIGAPAGQAPSVGVTAPAGSVIAVRADGARAAARVAGGRDATGAFARGSLVARGAGLRVAAAVGVGGSGDGGAATPVGSTGDCGATVLRFGAGVRSGAATAILDGGLATGVGGDAAREQAVPKSSSVVHRTALRVSSNPGVRWWQHHAGWGRARALMRAHSTPPPRTVQILPPRAT